MNTFNTKELYSVDIKTTYNLEIGEKKFSAGETLIHFDSLQLAALEEFKTFTSARGGKGNSELINWERTDAVSFICEKGVMSKTGMALLSNSQLAENLINKVEVPQTENIETDVDGILTLGEVPLKEFFIYDKKGNVPEGYIRDNKEVTGLLPFTEYIVKYIYLYEGSADILTVGQRLLNTASLSLCAKMRYEDDFDGLSKTGILIIPSIKLVSDLSIRLGNDIAPAVSVFKLYGLPVGERNNKYVCQLIYLDKDIDSDL